MHPQRPRVLPSFFRSAAALLCAAAGLLAARGADAQGVLIPRDGIRQTPFFVKTVRVNTTITDALAETTVEQVFANHSSTPQEGTYLFPLPDDATVTSFMLTQGDKVFEGKVFSKEEARRIYESIVRRRQDPGLLEYMDRGLFRASVFPIPAHGESTLTLKYAQALKPRGGVRRFFYPLSTGRHSTRPIVSTTVNVKLKTTTPLKTVTSPSHDVSVRRTGETTATASWEGRAEFPDRDFELYYGTSDKDVGLSLLTHQTGDRDGYFMLIAAPRVSVPNDKVIPKQVVFVLDRTGSMKPNGKMEQAKNALKFCLSSLNPSDRFTVIAFNESADALTKTLVPANAANVAKAQKFVADLDASGGTNINEALMSALSVLKNESGSQRMVVFLTDGLATVGETNTEKIIASVKDLNSPSRLVSAESRASQAAVDTARIFCFGVGYDVNVPFLDRLAEQNRGDADYVRPQENIEGIVSAFYSKIASPVLSRVALNFSGAEVYDVYPKTLPDLFKGSQLIVTGRYRGNPRGIVSLTGNAHGAAERFVLEPGFGDDAARSALVPRIWAARKIGFLLDQVRLQSNAEVVDEIVRLSREYGIITPYTSYLADDRMAVTEAPAGAAGPRGVSRFRFNEQDERRATDLARNELDSLKKKQLSDVGDAAVGRSLSGKDYQRAANAPASNQGGFGGASAGLGGQGGRGGGADFFDREKAALGGARSDLSLQFGNAAKAAARPGQPASNEPGYRQIADASGVQSVGGKVFYRRGAIWFDNAYKSGQDVLKIKALSDAHFQLLDAVPDARRYATVGDEVVVQVGKLAVQIGKEGREKLTADEIKELKPAPQPERRTDSGPGAGLTAGVVFVTAILAATAAAFLRKS